MRFYLQIRIWNRPGLWYGFRVLVEVRRLQDWCVTRRRVLARHRGYPYRLGYELREELVMVWGVRYCWFVAVETGKRGLIFRAYGRMAPLFCFSFRTGSGFIIRYGSLGVSLWLMALRMGSLYTSILEVYTSILEAYNLHVNQIFPEHVART